MHHATTKLPTACWTGCPGTVWGHASVTAVDHCLAAADAALRWQARPRHPLSPKASSEPSPGLQELNEILGRSSGIVVMTPPRDSKDAQASLATMVSALKPKHKVQPAPALQRLTAAQPECAQPCWSMLSSRWLQHCCFCLETC